MGTGENGSANQTCAEAAIKALPATTRIKSYAKAPARTWASVPAPGRANAGRIASAMVVIGGGVYPRRGGRSRRECTGRTRVTAPTHALRTEANYVFFSFFSAAGNSTLFRISR